MNVEWRSRGNGYPPYAPEGAAYFRPRATLWENGSRIGVRDDSTKHVILNGVKRSEESLLLFPIFHFPSLGVMLRVVDHQ